MGRSRSVLGLRDAQLRESAARVLRDNDRGSITVAAPKLYPHQWSWDAAITAVGLAHLSVRRACLELASLLAAQWRTGMIPHIAFVEEPETEYFPGPDWWQCPSRTDAAPRRPRTSGICQPPLHAIAVSGILSTAQRGDRADRVRAEQFVARVWQPLYAWHRWLIHARRDARTGLITVVHSWESGMDNSPRWDPPYQRVPVSATLPDYRRVDVGVVGDDTQRPHDIEYDRYLSLLEELKRARYDDTEIAARGSFRVGDVFVTAVLSVACDVLADLSRYVAVPASAVRTLRGWATALRHAVAASVDPVSGLARDRDVRAARWLEADTVAGFAPLLCGGLSPVAERVLLATLDGPAWCGHSDLVIGLPPSTTPTSPRFEPRRYWRGPLWPVVAWLYGWEFTRRSLDHHAARMRDLGLQLVADGNFAEYYEPFTGEPLGSFNQSWTAAVTLDWLERV